MDSTLQNKLLSIYSFVHDVVALWNSLQFLMTSRYSSVPQFNKMFKKLIIGIGASLSEPHVVCSTAMGGRRRPSLSEPHVVCSTRPTTVRPRATAGKAKGN